MWFEIHRIFNLPKTNLRSFKPTIMLFLHSANRRVASHILFIYSFHSISFILTHIDSEQEKINFSNLFIFVVQSCVLLQIPNTSINNGGIHTERKVGNRDRERNRVGSAESEHESLLTHETPKYLRHKQSLHQCTESGEQNLFSD